MTLVLKHASVWLTHACVLICKLVPLCRLFFFFFPFPHFISCFLGHLFAPCVFFPRHVRLWRPRRIIPAQPSPHLLPLPPSLLLARNLLLLPFILHLALISPSWFSFSFCILQMKVSARLHSLRWMSPNEEGLGRSPRPSPQTQTNTLHSGERGQIRGPYVSDPGLGWSSGAHERFESMIGVLKKKRPAALCRFFCFIIKQ